MSVAVPTGTIARWLYSTLSGDPTLQGLLGGAPPATRIYERVMPEGAASYPVVIFAHQADADVRPAGKQFVMVDALYQIKVVDKEESFAEEAEPVAAQVFALLDNQSGAASDGGLVLYCQRQRSFELDEVDEGTSYRHLGAIYRILAQ